MDFAKRTTMKTSNPIVVDTSPPVKSDAAITVTGRHIVSKSEIESVNTEDIKKNEWILLILLMLIITEILIRRTSGKK